MGGDAEAAAVVDVAKLSAVPEHDGELLYAADHKAPVDVRVNDGVGVQ